MASKKPWRIIPRPLLETILNNHAQHHRVHQPLILHGPRGVGKTTFILERVLNDWNKGPHVTSYVDFAQLAQPGITSPWASWSNFPPPSLSDCRNNLNQCLESMAEKALRLGSITSRQIFNSLNKWHGLTTALRRVLNDTVSKGSAAVLWDRAVLAMTKECSGDEIDRVLGFGEKVKSVLSVEEGLYFKESVVALKLAKRVIEIQQGFKGNAIANMNRTGTFSRTLTHSSTDWPFLLLDLLSQAAEIDHFQPKLVINNIEVLKHATENDEFSVSGPLYHDSLIWRIMALGANERCLPVILVTSDRTEAKMERPFETIAAVTNKKDFWKLAVRVKDKWTVVKDGKEHLEMIIVDAKGNDIQVLIPTEYKAKYDKILMENTTYTLGNFQVQMNDFVFKASEHKFKLKWTGGTTAIDVNLHDIPNPNTKFKPLAEIISGKWRPDLLYHVIGFVQDIGYCQLNEGTGKKLQVNFTLKDLSDISINCTLWEEYAAKFIQFNKERKDGGPLIVMLNYCKVKEEGRFPLSVSNTYSYTKLYLNDNIPEINLFRESIPKDDQLLSSSQMLCTQSYSSSQVATQDDLLSKNTILPLSQIIQLDQITYCVTVAKVEKVNSTGNGWYYFACHKCPKIAKGDKPPYTCDDGHNTETEIVRYKLEMDVSYAFDSAKFVVWDREVTQMLGISAAQLRLNMIQAGITNRFEYPMLMDQLAEKTFVFKVKWQPRWKSCSVVCYKEGPEFVNQVVARFPNVVLPEPNNNILAPAPMNEETLDVNNTDSQNVTISHGLSATSEFDPDSLSQLTPMSSFKNASVMNQITPTSSKYLGGQTSDDPAAEITLNNVSTTDVVVLSAAHADIIPAKASSSKRAKVIKQEKQ